jgi:uncharacterized protein involved in outer membrane biogenesis
MKTIKWAVLIVIVLVIVAAVVIYFNLSRIVRTTVANQSTQSLDLRTTVGGASVSLLGGSLGLSNVQIASPKGYAAPDMFTLGGVNVKVSYGQLRQNPIRIQDITISNPKLVIEQSGGKLNLQSVMDQLGAQRRSHRGRPSR